MLGQPGGLEESCLLYVGHWMLALVKHDLIPRDIQGQLTLLLMARMARANMPSTTKVLITIVTF